MDSATASTGGRYDNSYEIHDVPMGSRRRLRMVCIGAGQSGLMMSIVVSHKMQDHNIDFQVYEMNSDLGGTWLVNRYPGCQCDTPAHAYAYSFCPKPDWSNYYATSPEIHQYLKDTSKKHDCDKFFMYHHEVTSAIWDEPSGQWLLKVVNQVSGVEFEDTCHVLINAAGVLNNWKLPIIKGIESFRGKLMHSASWDESYNVANQKVAVIGIGSSGIQILPQVAKVAKHTTLFARSSTWITSQPGGNPPDSNEEYSMVDSECNYPPEIQQRFVTNPEYLLHHRQNLADCRIASFKASHGGRVAQPDSNNAYRSSMLERLGSSEKGKRIAEWLVPSFPVGCRRLTPGPGFLEALVQNNVESIWNGIASITTTGILTSDGNHLDFDAIICATGFDCSFEPRFPVIGRNGVSLAQRWTDGDPECYFGTTVAGFPNHFMFVGPNSPISNGGLVQGIQAQAVYIYKCVEKMQTQGIKSMEVKKEAMDEYNEHSQAYLRNSIWQEGCTSWYKRGTKNGRVVAIYAGSVFHFLEMMRHPRWEDYIFDYVGGKRSNRFAFLGNGFTRRESRNGTVGDTQTLDFEDFWKLMELPPIYD